MDQVINAFSSINQLGSSALFIALGLSAVLGHATLQMLKDLTPARSWYQRWWLNRWIGEKSDSSAAVAAAIKRRVPDTGLASTSLVDLATGGDADAFYELPAEQMVAQINAAVQVVLDYPALNSDLFLIVSQGITQGDAAAILGPANPGQTNNSAKVANKQQAKAQVGYQNARNRVGHRIQRNLDALQISLDSDWTWLMQFICLVISILVVEVAIFTTIPASADDHISAYVYGGAIGALGGYFGPVVNDIVSAVRGLNA